MNILYSGSAGVTEAAFAEAVEVVARVPAQSLSCTASLAVQALRTPTDRSSGSWVELSIRLVNSAGQTMSVEQLHQRAKQCDALRGLDMQMLRAAVRWMRKESAAEHVLVSLGDGLFNASDLASCVLEVTNDETDLHNRLCLGFRIESQMQNVWAIRRELGRLRRRGIRCALLDFGFAGAPMRLFAGDLISCVKLHPSILVDSVVAGERRVMQSIIHMLTRLGVDVVIDGVDSSQMFDFAQTFAHAHLQGFHVAPPVRTLESIELPEHLLPGLAGRMHDASRRD